jgi:hypothetical protein
MNSRDTPTTPKISVHGSKTCNENKIERTARDLMSDPKYDMPALGAGTLASAEPTDMLHDATNAARNTPKSLDYVRDTILVGNPQFFRKTCLKPGDRPCDMQPDQQAEATTTSLTSGVLSAARVDSFQDFPAQGMADDRNCSTDNRMAWSLPSWSTANFPLVNMVGALDKPRGNAYEEAPSASRMAQQTLLAERRASVPPLQELTYTTEDDGHNLGQRYASVPTTGTHFYGQIQESLIPQCFQELAQQLAVDMSSRASSPLSSCPPSEQLDLEGETLVSLGEAIEESLVKARPLKKRRACGSHQSEIGPTLSRRGLTAEAWEGTWLPTPEITCIIGIHSLLRIYSSFSPTQIYTYKIL